MATQRERIMAYLQAHPDGADDDVLSHELAITPRQTVNQICRQLASAGLLVREPGPPDGKIVNHVGKRGIEAALHVFSSPKPVRPPGSLRLHSVHQLDGAEAVRMFAYPGEVMMAEDTVKQAVEAALGAEDWEIDTRWGRAHGIDIEARRMGECLVLEAKGEGSRPAMRVNFFLGALGELLQRMDSPAKSYGLALPAHRQFVGLVIRLPGWVRARLDLRFYLVRPVQGGYQVGTVAPPSTWT